ncbi:MAG: class I SAM-dependent methyltransferase [Gemmataceae bacterium]|nr:class I SAM-dependent methyltransferase [Gemmataceae bacterium]MCI0742963.1 class I SAM-dependent methyltransferase [Gemmataceae bacterium]
MSTDPTERFTGLADVYAKFRPDYPAEALDYLVERCGLAPGDLVVDVGSGTGISSRLMAERGFRVIGIEPNADMRTEAVGTVLESHPTVRRATRRTGSESYPTIVAEGRGEQPEYRDGTGEATGLDDGCAAMVLCAQAFHWLKPERALAEFARILRPGGWAALVWNERDDRDPFTAAYSKVIRSAPHAERVENHRQAAGRVLLGHPLFEESSCAIFGQKQPMNVEQMIGRALSASYAPKAPAEGETFVAGLHSVFEEFQREGLVALHYVTSVYTGRRRRTL